MSLANYIIICDMDIRIMNADRPSDKLAAASTGAKELVTHIESRHPELTQADVQAISDLQHEFMDNMHTWKKEEAEAKIDLMRELVRALEDKFE